MVAFIGLWFAAPWFGSRFPETVAETERSYPHGVNATFGYAVHKYRWQETGFAVSIWASSSLKMHFDEPDLELT